MTSAESSAVSLRPPASRFRPAWLRWLGRKSKDKPLGAVSAVILLVLVLMSVFAPFVDRIDPTEIDVQQRLLTPRWEHWMGTDALGRDVYSRLVWGARTSLWIGLVVTILTTIAGLVVGVSSAYLGGIPDLVIQRVIDVLQAFPLLVLALLVIAVLGPSVVNVVLTLIVAGLARPARVLRGAALVQREEAYVLAAESLGASKLRIIMRHLVPNVIPPALVLASISLGGIILVQSTLEFLGLGVPPPTPTWGAMLSLDGRRFFERAPHLAIFPGLAIMLAVMAFNLLGDAVRDILDPRLRGG